MTALITQKRPVYLEVTEDVWRAACIQPVGKLTSGVGATITVSEVNVAVQSTLDIMMQRPKSIFWAGVEIQRYGLQEEFLALLNTLNTEHVLPDNEIKFVTTALSKSVISEQNKWFDGCVTLTKEEISHLVGNDGVLVGIGAWTTSKDTGGQDIRNSYTVLACHDGVFAGAEYFPSVQLKDYLVALTKAFKDLAGKQEKCLSGLRLPVKPKLMQASNSAEETLGYDNFYSVLGKWLTDDDIMVVDAGFPLIGAQPVPIPARDGFVAQAAWLAIGYSVPAGTGVGCAFPDKRAVVVVGDGAFHETCQAVADQHAYGLNTVVFVLANGIYGIEQYLVNPNPFRKPPVDYSNKLLDKVYPYNDLPKWNISKVTDAFGGEGRRVTNLGELMGVMEEIRSTPARACSH